MSIKPIDTQVMLHSTPDAAKLQSIQTSKDENAQLQSAQDMQKKIEKDSENVNAAEKTSKSNKVNRKLDSEKDNKGQQQNKKRKNNNEQAASTIDVRI